MGGDRSDRKDPRSFSNSTPSNSSSQNSVGNNEIKKQIETMNIKLDKILSLVHANTLKGALKEVTNESKDTPKRKTPNIIEKVVAKKISKKVVKK
jgi:hypothetical protein